MNLNAQERKALGRFKAGVCAALKAVRPEVCLFGSKARGSGTRNSDLDVLVTIAAGDWRLCDTVYQVAAELLVETGVCISPKVLTRRQVGQMKRDGFSFMRNVLKDAVPV